MYSNDNDENDSMYCYDDSDNTPSLTPEQAAAAKQRIEDLSDVIAMKEGGVDALKARHPEMDDEQLCDHVFTRLL